MTTDRELLEKAAKAVGMNTPRYVIEGRSLGWAINEGISVESGPTSQRLWNPLADDGDCARLEATLKLDVLWFANSVGVHGVTESYEEHDGDRQSARRRACVRAAAALGEQK